MQVVERFWSKVEKTASCWHWRGTVTKHGYGHFWLSEGKQVRAHKFAYEMLCEEVPHDKVLDHTCKNKLCVNPGHLEVVTTQENTKRWAASRDTCWNGHTRTPENLVTRRGRQECRLCVQSHMERSYEKARLATLARLGRNYPNRSRKHVQA